MRPAVVLISTLACGVAPRFGARAADNLLAETFARMDQASARFKGLSANVKKVSHTAVIDEDTVDSGTILVKRYRPHDLRMRVDIQQPDPKQILLVGTKAEIYYPRSKEVQTVDFGKKNHAAVEQFLLLGFGSNSHDLLSAYAVSLGGPETVVGQKTTRVELVPKSKDLLAQFPKFELWIADETGISVQQKIYQPGGDYSLATYTNVKINSNIPDSEMQLNLPKDVHREQTIR